MVSLQTLDLRIGVRVPASQPIHRIAIPNLAQSASIISFTSSSNPIRARHPSFAFALEQSPTRMFTSAKAGTESDRASGIAGNRARSS